jgi:hypothetical protein
MLPLPLADSFGGRWWEAKCGASEAVRTSWAGARHAYARSRASGGSNFLLGPVCHAALAAAGITNGAPFKSDSVPLGVHPRSVHVHGLTNELRQRITSGWKATQRLQPGRSTRWAQPRTLGNRAIRPKSIRCACRDRRPVGRAGSSRPPERSDFLCAVHSDRLT